MNRAARRREEKEKKKGNKDIVGTIKEDRQKLITSGLITSLEILKRDFGFTEEQLNEFSEEYLPELKNQMKL